MNFTEEQQLAIDKEGTNIIVSAGAGSGKTAVLTERVIRKIKSGVDIDKLLILTFTNEAANEMKDRIRKSMIKNNYQEQLSLLDSAYITTFDSFALSLVKKYHYKLNITNNIKIVDSNIIAIEKHKILDDIFEQKYGTEEFDKMISDYCQKDDTNIKEFIMQISDKIDLQIDKNEYLDNYISNHFNENYINSIIKEYNKLIIKKINELKKIYNELLDYCNDKLVSKLDSWLKILFENKEYNNLVLFKTMPSVKFIGLEAEGIELKEEFKSKLSQITEMLRFENEEVIKNSIIETKKYINVIIDIIKELNAQIDDYKDKYQVFEFNDISHMAINLVKNNVTIRNEIKNTFNEIMIDEYQDTSSIQECFINYIENNNIYMVGDIKQSIYRFRNANPYIFQKKYNNYQNNLGGIKIDLVKNFRSRKETLFNINEIFNLIMDDEIGNAEYIKGHNMVYGNTQYDNENTGHDNNLEIYNYTIDEKDKFTKEEKELFIISEDIQDKINNKYQILDKKTGKLRDITFKDICIITDRNKHLITYRKILEYNKIPSVIYMDEELTSDNVILVIKNLINLIIQINEKIYDTKTKYLFTSVSRSFIFNYDDNKIYTLLNDKTYYNDIIIEKCKQININEPLPNIINNIINIFDIYNKLISLTDIEKNIVRINNLIDISNNVSILGYSLKDFINYLDNTIKMGLSVKYSQSKTSANAVKIMNIHKSKGLEFSLCYFTGMHNKFTIKEITNKFLTSNKYGIILPYKDKEELNTTILKDLYTEEYYNEEISEKIRLLYVALTRSREKMIILANLDEEIKGYNHFVPSEERIKYRSFLDILKSLNILNKYIKTKSANYTEEYKKNKIKNIDKNINNEIIKEKSINITYEKIDKKQFSKKKKEIISKDDIKKMDFGKEIHKIFEYEDFKNPKNKYVINFLKLINSNFINVYHEYEFIYEEGSNIYNGIIDLLVEYDDCILIIDYKLKDIDDENYQRQLNGYKNYIEKITKKEVKTLLYSIIDNKLVEVNNEE